MPQEEKSKDKDLTKYMTSVSNDDNKINELDEVKNEDKNNEEK